VHIEQQGERVATAPPRRAADMRSAASPAYLTSAHRQVAGGRHPSWPRRRTCGDPIPQEERMRRLIATIAAALALTGVGLATHTASSDALARSGMLVDILPYIEQDNLF
jgi:hypothetical protein